MVNRQEGNGSQPRSCTPESRSNQVESHTNSLPATSVSFVGHPRPGRKSPQFSAGTTSDVTDTGVYFITALTNEQPSTAFSVPLPQKEQV